ncbi:3-dehydroshikimate dehydratase [Pseudocercospora fuligena]|uniref:3-dehydroshikimate dehydratase n=1 Tax=Pseudocercospora fuligena TaxID=685502 RepID=A0A8H6VTN1_9PEZI|nr:3-dehydroshikimate dehydratase [Pseudocercospora fuligena]
MDKHKLASSTVSLGWHDAHTLPLKLQAAKSSGFKSVEVVHGDLEKEADRLGLSHNDCAIKIRQHCDELGLKVISIAPFENYEGSPSPLAQRLRKAFEWIHIARVLGADIVQVPASFDHKSLAVSEDQIIEELRHLADAGLPKEGTDEVTIIIAYEPMSWSVRSNTWQHALDLKHRVSRPNFKLCLDTYHILTKLWADCTMPDGKIPGGGQALKLSLYETLRLMQPEDVALVQLSDAERMQPPISHHGLRSMGKHYAWHWSGVGRIFPLEAEHGAYLPMLDITRTWLIDLGWSGWVSMEIFHKSMDEEERGPQYWAGRGMNSWERLRKTLAKTELTGSRL